jgi:hypothetical protein
MIFVIFVRCRMKLTMCFLETIQSLELNIDLDKQSQPVRSGGSACSRNMAEAMSLR